MDNAEGADIAALVGARICHDLAGALGALGNGVELVERAGTSGAELEMVADTARGAQDRLATLRMAFAPAGDEATSVTPVMLHRVARGLRETSRLAVSWQPVDTALPRREVRLAVLLGLCAGSAMPRGGTLQIRADAEALTLDARGARCTPDPALWDLLEGAPPPATLRPAQVHFAVAAMELHRRQRRLSMRQPEPGALQLRC